MRNKNINEDVDLYVYSQEIVYVWDSLTTTKRIMTSNIFKPLDNLWSRRLFLVMAHTWRTTPQKTIIFHQS